MLRLELLEVGLPQRLPRRAPDAAAHLQSRLELEELDRLGRQRAKLACSGGDACGMTSGGSRVTWVVERGGQSRTVDLEGGRPKELVEALLHRHHLRLPLVP